MGRIDNKLLDTMAKLNPGLILPLLNSGALALTPWEMYLREPTPTRASVVERIEYTAGVVRG